jgi:Uma2 family endonuclease
MVKQPGKKKKQKGLFNFGNMGIANKIIPHYTYNDWINWEGKWELIEGFPIAMSPAPIPRHQKVSAKIISQFDNALSHSTCNNCSVYNFIDYKISEDTILQPDILIVCGEIKQKYLDFPPSLVVEILSPATALKDRHTKYELYEQQQVKYYLIADADKKTIEVFELKDKKYNLQPELTYHFLLNGCSITPDFSKVFD